MELEHNLGMCYTYAGSMMAAMAMMGPDAMPEVACLSQQCYMCKMRHGKPAQKPKRANMPVNSERAQ